VIANEPALNYTGTRLSNVAVGRALYNNAAGWLNLSQDAAGAEDREGGLRQARRRGRQHREQRGKLPPAEQQILDSLACPGGADTGPTCLSKEQLDTVRAIEIPLAFSTYSLANGVKRAGGYNILEGTLVAGPFTTRDLGTSATTRDANVYVTGDQWVKYFVTRNANFDR
jgi:hypothetical protein